MEMQPFDEMDDRSLVETPEDLAIVYSRADLEDAKYRDFSANRREYRAQMRHRAAEQLRVMELRAQSEAEAAAASAEAEAAAAHAEADAASVKLATNRTMQATGLMKSPNRPEDHDRDERVEHMRQSSLREAAQQARRAAAERLEAARRAEAAALADSIARREEREIAEAQASSLRQAAQYAESEVGGRQKRAILRDDSVLGRIPDTNRLQVVAEGEYFERSGTPVSELEAIHFRQRRESIKESAGVGLPPFRTPEAILDIPQRDSNKLSFLPGPYERPRVSRPDEPSGRRTAAADESLTGIMSEDNYYALQDFEPLHEPKPVYEQRYLAIACDVHRQDEAGALQLPRERNRSADTEGGTSGPQGRVAVPSFPYKEFRRSVDAYETCRVPEVIGRIPEEFGGPVSESQDDFEYSSFRGIETSNRSPQSVAGKRWAPPITLPAGERDVEQLPIRNEGAKLTNDISEAPPSPSFRLTGSGSEAPLIERDDGKLARTAGTAAPAPHPAHDSWGAAWDRSDSSITDEQSTWSNRLESAKGKPQRNIAHSGKVPLDSPGPAWLYPRTDEPRFVDSLAHSRNRAVAKLAVESMKADSGQTLSLPEEDVAPSTQVRGNSGESTLHPARQHMVPRWFALKSVFAKPDRGPRNEDQPEREEKRNTPFVVVYSLAGGVGKTSLVATLGRTLSSLGEKVLLTDTQGLLPFYFGASDLHRGVVRKFSPPSGSTDAPIHLVSYDFAKQESESIRSGSDSHTQVFEELVTNSKTANRVLMDLDVNCGWMVARLARLKPTILVPLAADMNSVISLQTLERSFHGIEDAEGNPLQPTYLLNQFDPSRPLQLDVREVLRQQLGERLLPFFVRGASAVGEALAEGMTIVDYDPDSEVAKDYMGVANWLRNTSAPTTVGLRNLRWSER